VSVAVAFGVTTASFETDMPESALQAALESVSAPSKAAAFKVTSITSPWFKGFSNRMMLPGLTEKSVRSAGILMVGT
jgi:hypothetical protein